MAGAFAADVVYDVHIHMSAVGRYEDELVKRDGVRLIAKRRRIQ